MQLTDIQKDLTRDLEKIDCMIIVHPDHIINFGAEYLRNLAFATYFCQLSNKPIFAIADDNEDKVRRLYPDQIASIWQFLDPREYFYPVFLKDISDLTEKPINNLTLAFAGIFYEDCPNSLARRTCASGAFPELKFGLLEDAEYAPAKAKFGYVIRNLCVKP